VTESAVDQAQFRQLLGRFATGVTVITARDPEGRPHGMTANSLASVSLEPPLLLLSIDHGAAMHGLLLTAPVFAVNILASNQETVSRRFAVDRAERFEGIGYQESPRGLILLDGALAHLECERDATHEAGDHTILVGRVVAGTALDGRPLCYFRGGYASLA
jgi:flavin reductase (DIM6/NTAB) family NADH-FMN oxidoreductase RutF